MYHGDFRLGKTFDIKFATVQATGAPTTLAGSPVVAAYPDNSTTEITAGITLSVDFDSRTGLNNVRVVATGGNGFATATNYALVLTAGTVNTVSVVGYVVGSFSIEARSALNPTTVDLTLDVSATGEAGVDWANVGGKTTVNALTNTSIITTQKVDIETIKTNPVVNAGTITFPTTATLASTTNLTAGTIATVSGNVNGSVGSVTGAVGSVTGAVGSVTGAVGSVTGNVGGNVTGTVASVVGAVGSVTGNVGGSVGSVLGAVGSVTGNVGGNVVGTVASVVAAVAITSNIKKNQALAAFEFLMTDSTNHNPAAGLVVAVTRSIDGGAFAAGTLSAVTEISAGIYAVDFGAGDLNGKVIVLKATAAASDTRYERIVTQP